MTDYPGKPGPKPARKATGARSDLKAPRHLSTPAKRIWRRLYASAGEAGLLADLDADLLAMVASDLAFMQLAMAQLGDSLTKADAAHKDTPRKNPLWVIYCQSRDRAFAGLRELGMSPAARAQRNIELSEGAPELEEMQWLVEDSTIDHEW